MMDVSPRALCSLLSIDLDDDGVDSSFGELSPHGGPGITPRQLAASRLKLSLTKKLLDEEETDAENKAYSLWNTINTRCSLWRLDLGSSQEEILWNEFKNSVYRFFTDVDFELSWNKIFENSRVGPGATIDAKSTDMYSKLFDSSLSSTSSLLHLLYQKDTINHPSWFAAERSRAGSYGSSVVKGSRLSFVPKTRYIRRSICVEPNLNIYAQLGLGRILEGQLFRRFGISLDRQPDKNRALAKRGSVYGDYATIDLSSASDSISYGLCEELIPAEVLGYFYQLRSPFTSYRGKWHQVHMISSMGNGFTFPLQTILFACMVEAAYRCRGLKIEKPFGRTGNFGVFGDDIIVYTGGDLRDPLSVYRDVLTLLRLSGFTVNPEKTFSEGSFRESCGCEFYAGVDVRGVYVKTLRTVPGRYVAINRLLEWSAGSGILLPRVIKYLRDSVPDLRIPFDGPYDGGVKVPRSLARPGRSLRYQSAKFQYLAPRAVSYSFGSNGLAGPLARRMKIRYNPEGLYMVFLAGHLRDGAIGVRSNPTRYHRRWKVTPNWDYFPRDTELTARFGWTQWETTVELTLA